MNDNILDIANTRVLLLADKGPILSATQDANDFLGQAWGSQADLMAIPTSRLSDDFFRLRTRLAGEVIQKFVNYRLRLALIGDISTWVGQSDALRDFVHESNQGAAVWFVPDLPALERRLAQQP